MKEVMEDVVRIRYLKPGEENIQDMYRRVANAIGQTVDERTKLFEYMSQGVFLFNSPTLANAGTSSGTLSACFVLPIDDSLEGIYKTVHDMGLVHAAFGGTGFDFSRIRPAGAKISSTGGEACGPVLVAKFLDANASMVKQGGKRHGANMGILRVDHPDVVKWITAKKDESIRHFNFSVAITDEFMNDLGSKSKVWPCGKSTQEIWDLICNNAWAEGNPGLFFVDTANADHPTEWVPIAATNPCGEQPLGNYESCNLGSINLASEYLFPEGQEFQYDRFEEVIRAAVRALDHVIDLNVYPIPEIERATKMTRRIGLGVMGWADYLIKSRIDYDSNEAIDEIGKVGEFMMTVVNNESFELAEELGPYPAWQEPLPKARNATCMTIAPTGTLSKFANCSSGIEPIFGVEYDVFTEQGTYHYVHPLKNKIKAFKMEDEVAHKISISDHIRHQATWQHYVDNAVSKTINLPSQSTIEDVSSAFRSAWRCSCKGITIYRDKSKTEQVLSIPSPESIPCEFTRRPGHLYEVLSGCGKNFIWIDYTDESYTKFNDIFVISAGGCVANNETTGRILSQEMQAGISPRNITMPLHKVKCINAIKNPNSQGKSCADIIGKAIDFEVRDFLRASKVHSSIEQTCPSCGGPLTREAGCASGTCIVCGWNGCS
jgi:ribonucleoside-diphosphate reductase alpha chain